MEIAEREALEARQFRELLERLGGVFIKLGQQLSQRADVLSPVYCEELLSFLEDIGEEIPFGEVETVISRSTGKSIPQIFEQFFPDPIGSASVSCVYRAFLKTGEEVAVKVRRPGIARTFTADLKGLKGVFRLLEILTVWRPGISRNFRNELTDLLFEELDFLKEARYQELFRRYLKRRKKLKVTAPKVYQEYSSSELMVSEFVHARKMQRIIDALEQEDEQYLAELAKDGIEPKKLAKHLVRSRYYSFHECPLFHGDPHPANILVRPKNEIVMIDFGACGVFSERDRNLMWQLNRNYSKENVAGMVDMVIRIMEPVDPASGIHQFRKDLTDAWWEGFYAIKSKHAEGWERSSVLLWIKFFQLVREHKIPIPTNVVRMVRATLLYDTVASRLYPKLNVFKEFEKYADSVARRTRRHIEKCAIRQILLGPDDANFLKMQQIADVANGLLFWTQRFLDNHEFSFVELADKIYSAVRAAVRAIGLAILVGAVVLLMAFLHAWSRSALDSNWGPFRLLRYLGGSVIIDDPVLTTLGAIWFVLTAAFIAVSVRRIYLRFGDVDTNNNRRR
jgi:ubiquinone biosynthesis protein